MQERLFEDRDNEIMELASTGELTYAQIAERYSISRQRVSAIVNRNREQKSADERELDRLYAQLSEFGAKPEPRLSAIGKIAVDPETGRVIRNKTESIAAINAQIKIVKERRAQRAEETIEEIDPEFVAAMEWVRNAAPDMLRTKQENMTLIAKLEAERMQSTRMREELVQVREELERWERGELVLAEVTYSQDAP